MRALIGRLIEATDEYVSLRPCCRVLLVDAADLCGGCTLVRIHECGHAA
jgi:hypothetical protein